MLKIAVTNRTNIKEQYTYNRVNKNYFDAVLKSGAYPFMLPNADYETLKEMMKEMDGLIITGGVDIHPSLYNEEITYAKDCNIEDDLNDLRLIKICLELNKPILGICRGLQIINVYFKGTLYQDLNKEGLTETIHDQELNKNGFIYTADFKDGSVMHDIFQNQYHINSFHHQAIKKLGNGLDVTGISEDNVIEAVELKNKILAVQWHPEQLISNEKHLNLFKVFNNICLSNKTR